MASGPFLSFRRLPNRPLTCPRPNNQTPQTTRHLAPCPMPLTKYNDGNDRQPARTAPTHQPPPHRSDVLTVLPSWRPTVLAWGVLTQAWPNGLPRSSRVRDSISKVEFIIASGISGGHPGFFSSGRRAGGWTPLARSIPWATRAPVFLAEELSANKLPNQPEPVSVQFPRKPGANAPRLISNSVG
jgi:hypothetical protein